MIDDDVDNDGAIGVLYVKALDGSMVDVNECNDGVLVENGLSCSKWLDIANGEPGSATKSDADVDVDDDDDDA